MRAPRTLALSLGGLLIAGTLSAQTTTTPPAGAKPGIAARAMRTAMRGVKPTAAQREAIASIRVTHQRQFATLATNRAGMTRSLGVARQRGDTVAMRQTRQAVRLNRQRTATAIRTMLLDVRAQLTPPQQHRLAHNRSAVTAQLRTFVRTGKR